MAFCEFCFSKYQEPEQACGNIDCSTDPNTESNCRAIADRSDMHVPEFTELAQAQDGSYVIYCPNCKNTSRFVEVCPNCRSLDNPELDIDGAEVFTVALTGSRNAGKTVYMVSLITTLRRMLESRRYTMRGIGTTDADFKENYYDVLYEGRKVLEATRNERQKALYFSIQGNKRKILLVIQDIAGESLQNVGTTRNANQRLFFLTKADLIIFMYDPYTVSGLMNALNGIVSSDNVQSMAGDSLLGALINSDLLGSQSKLALVISKFDVILSLGELGPSNPLSKVVSNPGLSYMVDDSPLPDYRWDYEEAMILDADIRSLMSQREFGAANLLNSAEQAFAERPLDLCTFAVSQLGSAPSGAAVSSAGIAPFRCIDPLQWGYARTHDGQPML